MLRKALGLLRRDWIRAAWPARSALRAASRLSALVTIATPCFAQSSVTGVDLRYDYDALLKRQERNRTTPGAEFGDQHSLENGSLSFNVVDVDIPGNSDLVVEFRRTLALTDPMKRLKGNHVYPATRLGDWALGLPKIEATFDAKAGWITSDSSRPTKNCSLTSSSYFQPPDGQEYPQAFRAHMFWNPPTIHYPDGGSGLLIYRGSGSSARPVPSTGGPYYWVTSSHDVVACIASLKNKNDTLPAGAEERIFGQGEGYLVTRPDGTKYWFDWIALESKLPSVSSAPQTGCCNLPLTMEVEMQQATLALYPSRVEDRFGNWVTYTYSNKSNEAVKLDSIQSSDGRVINVGYTNGRLTTVTAGGRTWSYIYNGSDPQAVPFHPMTPYPLTEVRQPDTSSWRYSGVSHPSPTAEIQWPCYDLTWTNHVNADATSVGDTDFTGFTVDSPSGARAVFRLGVVILGRSAVQGGCYQPGMGVPGQARQYTVPRYFLGGRRYALTGKKITGPGLTPAIWKYHYQSDIGFAPMANGTTRTKVLNPDGVVDNYTFGNTFGVDEGLLLNHTRTFNQQTVLSVANAYAAHPLGTTTLGYPKLIGYFPDSLDRTSSTFFRPLLGTTRIQDGATFRYTVNSLDEFARPTKVTKSGSLSP